MRLQPLRLRARPHYRNLPPPKHPSHLPRKRLRRRPLPSFRLPHHRFLRRHSRKFPRLHFHPLTFHHRLRQSPRKSPRPPLPTCQSPAPTLSPPPSPHRRGPLPNPSPPPWPRFSSPSPRWNLCLAL